MPYKPDLELVQCPFNKQHVFTRDRLQAHIIKCSKNYPVHYTCPYFNLHRFLTLEERDAHVFLCDKKTYLEPMAKHTAHGKIDVPITHFDVPQLYENDENWESEYQNRR